MGATTRTLMAFAIAKAISLESISYGLNFTPRRRSEIKTGNDRTGMDFNQFALDSVNQPESFPSAALLSKRSSSLAVTGC